MREPYDYPVSEEPLAEVMSAVALDDFYEKRHKRMLEEVAQQLILKYRPITFDEVLGNKLAVEKLAEAVKTPTRPHGYIFSGSTGIGKTTLARIVAEAVNASVTELCAALNSSIDDTRALVEGTGFVPITVKPNRMIIIDEAHNLSKKAWEPLLKLIEEPPSYIYIAICTTEYDSIPDAVRKGRCYNVQLKPLKTQEIENLVQLVSDVEGWKVENDVFAAICQAANGSARYALSILQAGHSVKTRDELAQVVATVESEDNPMLQLCGYLIKGGRAWIQVAKYLERVDEPEAALMLACRYFTNALPRSQEVQAKEIYRLLRAFTDTHFSYDKKVQLYSAVGKVLWGEVPF